MIVIVNTMIVIVITLRETRYVVVGVCYRVAVVERRQVLPRELRNVPRLGVPEEAGEKEKKKEIYNLYY